ncbi:MAG: MBL fold metallo-hydrolase [Acidimicrobiales bacterium]
MVVTTLGTSSPYPRPQDPCSSFLLDGGGSRLWIDTGAGALGALLRHCPLEELDAIWVSHTHADHFSDLAVTFYALRYADISRSPLSQRTSTGLSTGLSGLFIGTYSILAYAAYAGWRDASGPHAASLRPRFGRGWRCIGQPYACPMQLPQLNLSEGWPAIASAERDRQRRSGAKRAVRVPPREVFMFGAQVDRQSPMNGSFTG